MSPEAEARFRGLFEVNDGSGLGDVDGVRFDLRSELSSGGPAAGDWFGGDRIGEERYHSVPFEAFPAWRPVSWPWARPDWAAIWNGRREVAQKRGLDPESPRGRRFTLVGLARNVPEVAVVAGDTVVVGRIERVWEGDFFDQSDDAEIAYLYLSVRHADGRSETLEAPRRYWRRNAFGRRGDAIRLANRVTRRWNLENLNAYKLAYDLIDGGITWNEAALERTQAAFNTFDGICRRVKRVKEHYPDELSDTLDRMVDWFVSAGYALAKAEAEDVVMPAARRGRKNVADLRRAAAARSQVAIPILEAAQADIDLHPGTSQNACAGRVAAKMEKDQRSVFRTIEPLFERRPLAVGRGFVKRPKRIVT